MSVGVTDRRAMWQAIFFGAVMISGATLLAAAPRDAGHVAVMAWPWSGPDAAVQIIARADARIVSSGLFAWIAVASDDRPDLEGRLYSAGAFVVADARFVSACLGIIR